MKKEEINLSKLHRLIEELLEGDCLTELKYGNTQTIDYDGTTILLEHVADYGGEGQGDDYWLVAKVLIGEEQIGHLRWDGWYASYDGGYLEDAPKWVEPVEKTVIHWE